VRRSLDSAHAFGKSNALKGRGFSRAVTGLRIAALAAEGAKVNMTRLSR
jgi:hypothetical protein